MTQTICLVGFMGSGKTTIGKALAKQLGVRCVDLDAYIEEALGETIAHIFETKGEDYFREKESYYLREVLANKVPIVATGGGIVGREENRVLLKTKNTFYLKYKCDTLYGRIVGDTTRPLASNYETIYTRYMARQGWYEAAAKYVVEGEGESVEALANKILSLLGKKAQ